MTTYYAECLDMDGNLMPLKIRAMSKGEAGQRIMSEYNIETITRISDKRLYQQEYDGQFKSSLAMLI